MKKITKLFARVTKMWITDSITENDGDENGRLIAIYVKIEDVELNGKIGIVLEEVRN